MPQAKISKIFIAALAAVHLSIVIPIVLQVNIWADEASTLFTTEHGLRYALETAAANEHQAPLYFWILSVWRTIDGSIFWAHIFSILCSVAAIPLFASLASRLFERRTALLAATFFTFHPYLIWASLEIRVYSLVILISIGLMRLFAGTFDNESDSRFRYIFFGVLSVIALYTNYYLGFLLLAFAVSLAATGRWRQLVRYLIIMCAAAAAFAPLVLTVIAQFSANAGGIATDRSLTEGLRNLWHHFVTFALPVELFPNDPEAAILAIRAWIVRLAVIGTAIFTFVHRQRLSRRTLRYFSIAGTLLLCLLAAYFALGTIYVEIRHMAVAYVPLIVAIASLIDDIGTGEKGIIARITPPAAMLLIVASFLSGLVTLYPNNTKRGDWARVAEFISQNDERARPIIIFPVYDALALPYYYKGNDPILPAERFFDFGFEGTGSSNETGEHETGYVISQFPADADEVWLVTSDKCSETSACSLLDNFVEANYTVITEQVLYKEKVQLLKRKQ